MPPWTLTKGSLPQIFPEFPAPWARLIPKPLQTPNLRPCAPPKSIPQMQNAFSKGKKKVRGGGGREEVERVGRIHPWTLTLFPNTINPIEGSQGTWSKKNQHFPPAEPHSGLQFAAIWDWGGQGKGERVGCTHRLPSLPARPPG